MNRKPMALQLHCPRTSTDIGVEKNATVAFPVPIGVLKNWMKSSS